MDAAARYAREYLLRNPAVVVLRAPTGYLKTSATRIAAQRSRAATVVDCLELASAADVAAALEGHATPATVYGAGVEDFIAFENAEAALAKPAVLAAIHDVLSKRAPRQTIAICTRRPFPLPPDVISDAIELTHEDLALDVAEELKSRGLPAERIAEIRRMTLGWPMATYRLAAIAADSHPGVPLTECHGRAYDRLLQDVRLDFIDRLPLDRRERLLADYRRDRDGMLAYVEPTRRDLLASKLARVDGLLLRDGAHYRFPSILFAALDAAAATTFSEVAPAAASEPAIVFDVLTGEITIGDEVTRLPRREFEVFVNLAVKGRHVPYDVLLEEIWGDADNEPAKLKVTVGRLRKRLGFGTIRSVDAGYVLGGNVTCTLPELEELASAPPPPLPATVERLETIRLRHQRGMMGAARHWPWYGAWSAKIEALVERADITLGYHALAQRRYAVALERAHEAIALNAVSQAAHELALRVLVAQGSVVAARQMLTTYETTLRRTLGIGLPESLERMFCEMAS
jgi:DNA-binding winged helix-turn-helix (wHTH) protein